MKLARKSKVWQTVVASLGIATLLMLAACSDGSDAASNIDDATSQESSIRTFPESSEESSTDKQNLTTRSVQDQPSSDGEASEAIPAESEVTTTALEMNWFVVGVDADDSLNVREAPGVTSEILATIDNFSTNFEVEDQVQSTGSQNWRKIQMSSGESGWVNERFIIAQPNRISATEKDALLKNSEGLIDWAQDQKASSKNWIAERGLWVNEMQRWHWESNEELKTSKAWQKPRIDETPDGIDDEDCDTSVQCSRSLNDFLNFSQLGGSTEALLDDRNFRQGNSPNFIASAPQELHWVVFDFEGTDAYENLDWQRLYFIFDWSTGEPKIAAIYSRHWTT